MNNENLIKYDDRLVLPSLLDAWISGFTDSEGCFIGSILNNSTHAFRMRFILTQKHDINKYILLHILNLFNELNSNIKEKSVGSIVPHYIKNVWELRINGINNCKIIFYYFDKFKLKSKKRQSYLLFKDVLLKIENKEHLDLNKRIIIKNLMKDINK